MTEKEHKLDTVDNLRRILVSNYARSPDLLHLRLAYMFKPIEGAALHNNTLTEIETMIGIDNVPLLLEGLARHINTLSGAADHDRKRTEQDQKEG